MPLQVDKVNPAAASQLLRNFAYYKTMPKLGRTQVTAQLRRLQKQRKSLSSSLRETLEGIWDGSETGE